VDARIVPEVGLNVYALLLKLKFMPPAVVFVIVVTDEEWLAVALPLAAQELPPQEPPIAFARLLASVLAVPERTIQ